MGELDLIREVRESVIRIEGKLDNMADKHNLLEKRVSKLEDNNTWLIRVVVAQIVGAVIAFFIINK
jgi:type IV secretory pathway component VirB8